MRLESILPAQEQVSRTAKQDRASGSNQELFFFGRVFFFVYSALGPRTEATSTLKLRLLGRALAKHLQRVRGCPHKPRDKLVEKQGSFTSEGCVSCVQGSVRV